MFENPHMYGDNVCREVKEHNQPNIFYFMIYNAKTKSCYGNESVVEQGQVIEKVHRDKDNIIYANIDVNIFLEYIIPHLHHKALKNYDLHKWIEERKNARNHTKWSVIFRPFDQNKCFAENKCYDPIDQ